MSKEFFDAHFHPERHTLFERFTNGLNYYLSTLVFNAFPFPQREAGARQTLRYAGELVNEGWCIVIFPEGRITDTGEIGAVHAGSRNDGISSGRPGGACAARWTGQGASSDLANGSSRARYGEVRACAPSRRRRLCSARKACRGRGTEALTAVQPRDTVVN